MNRRWNVSAWAGFGTVLVAFLTYVPVFTRFPITRDFPWANLLLFGAGLALLARGLGRAYREPQLYRGRIFAPVLMGLGVLILVFFCYGVLVASRQLPASSGAPHVGSPAPDFTLPDQDGRSVSLSALLGHEGGEALQGVLLIFYRGYW
jgi:hypothetical protein